MGNRFSCRVEDLRVHIKIPNDSKSREANSNYSILHVSWTNKWKYSQQGNHVPKPTTQLVWDLHARPICPALHPGIYFFVLGKANFRVQTPRTHVPWLKVDDRFIRRRWLRWRIFSPVLTCVALTIQSSLYADRELQGQARASGCALRLNPRTSTWALAVMLVNVF